MKNCSIRYYHIFYAACCIVSGSFIIENPFNISETVPTVADLLQKD